MLSTPAISVVLPVYNGLPYLRAAVESVLTQSFRDFELIVINDGSSDGSAELLAAFDDPRLRLSHQENRGLAATLNIGIAQARGHYIARQDQDDICLPGRFEKQVTFLDSHPHVGLLGTAAEIWVASERTARTLCHPAESDALRFGLLFNNYFVHSSVMLRRAVFDSVGGYAEDSARQPPEDYELWSRVARQFEVANLPDTLLAYREVPNSMSRTGNRPFLRNLVRISAENIAFACNLAADDPRVAGLAALLHDSYEDLPAGLELAQMQNLLDTAARSITGQTRPPSAAFGRVVQQTRRDLRYRFLNHRSGGMLGKLTRSRLGLAAKKWLRGGA